MLETNPKEEISFLSEKIISGKEVSSVILAELKTKIAEDKKHKEQNGCYAGPGLAVIQVGNDPASSIYVKNKQAACEKIGIKSFGYRLEETVSEQELLELIHCLNEDRNVDGILCQLPLPKHIQEFNVISAISPLKDVDGFHPINKGLLSMGHDCFISCTPLGCLRLLQHYGVEVSGKHCVVIGRSNIVGKPLAALMLEQNATVTIAHSKTKDLSAICKQADILIAAVGRPLFVTSDFVKPGAIVIDVGINRDQNNHLCGDVDFDQVVKIAKAITPVPGGVGPMTITMLLENTYTSYLARKGENR